MTYIDFHPKTFFFLEYETSPCHSVSLYPKVWQGLDSDFSKIVFRRKREYVFFKRVTSLLITYNIFYLFFNNSSNTVTVRILEGNGEEKRGKIGGSDSADICRRNLDCRHVQRTSRFRPFFAKIESSVHIVGPKKQKVWLPPHGKSKGCRHQTVAATAPFSLSTFLG